jgi:transcriptional regulator with XRE-family HTH domain
MNSVKDLDHSAVQLQLAFAYNVRTARNRLGWTQEELAHRSGVPREALVLIERGTADADLHIVAALANALGCEVAELLRLLSSDRKGRLHSPSTRT